jgi:subtilisin family serine protease
MLSQSGTAAAPADKPEGDPAQYTLDKLRVPLAHGLAKGNEVLVAVIDSGVDTTHPEFAGVIADTFDALDPSEPPHAHGTAIAGAIAAHSRLMGVAPAAKILAVRAFGDSKGSAEGTTFNIIKSLEWSMGKGAQVINMSFAGPQDPALSRRLSVAHAKGIVLIAAVGNAGAKSPPLYPAADANVIAVTATDSNDKLFNASNRGQHIAIAAPGVDILLPSPGASYQVSSGTSFAAAHVSGIAALILERKRDLKPDDVRRILVSTAKDLGPKGRDIYFGAGLADAYQALTAAETGVPVSSNASASR